MNSSDGQPLVLGRVKGIRGPDGEITVTVISGDAARWVELTRVVLGGTGPKGAPRIRKVESARGYRDRLVLKLAGIDDANQASELRGCEVSALADDVPQLPEGTYWVERLVGAQVMDSVLGDIGRVMDVVETGGVDLLLVKDVSGRETLVPLASKFVSDIDEKAGTIRVALPAGLTDINEDEARGAP